MARLRYNGLSTTLGGSGLTNSATSVTFAAALTHSGGTNVPTITGTDYIPLSILDSTGKLSEVVFLTAYTAAATTGTIVRGMEGTTGVSHSLGDKVICGPTVIDVAPGSSDVPPAAPNAKDDEFDGTSSVTWTATPTAAAVWSVNSDRANHVHIQATTTQGANNVGRYQAVPGAYPYTITTKLSGHNLRTNFSAIGMVLAPASPTGTSSIVALGPAFNSGSSTLAVRRWSNNFANSGSYTETVAPSGWASHFQPVYLRMTVSSATSVDLLTSLDGWAWIPVQSALNPGFTPGVMGLVASFNSGNTVDAYFDFFRVT